MGKFTADSFFGRTIRQPSDGYRFSIDPFLLAAQISPPTSPYIIDIGCGCGIICLLLAKRLTSAQITGVEIQSRLARFAQMNTRDLEYESRINILNADINKLLPEDFNKKADIIVSNPPYKKKGTGRKNPNQQKAIARHELFLNLAQLCNTVNTLLCESGKFYVIYPVDRLSELIQTTSQYKLEPHFIKYVHPRPGNRATRFIACFGKRQAASGLRLLRPIYLYDIDNFPTEEHLSLFRS